MTLPATDDAVLKALGDAPGTLDSLHAAVGGPRRLIRRSLDRLVESGQVVVEYEVCGKCGNPECRRLAAVPPSYRVRCS